MSNIPVLTPNASISLAMSENDRRDQFAMAALTGLIANSESSGANISYFANGGGAEWIAGISYKIADAMMEVRKK